MHGGGVNKEGRRGWEKWKGQGLRKILSKKARVELQENRDVTRGAD